MVRLLDIDRLDIVISSEARRATKNLDKLSDSLNGLSNTLSGIDSSGLSNLSDGIQRLSSAMQGINGITTRDFTRISKNIEKLASISSSKLSTAASSVSNMSSALSNLNNAVVNVEQIGEMAKNISKLGNKGVQIAIDNMPKLANALKEMMRSLQSAPKVSSNLIRMTEAMGKLASNGNRVGTAARSLGTKISQYGRYTEAATRKTKSLASAIGMLYAKFWVFQRAFKGLFSAIEESMDFTETVNYFNVAMNKIGDDASRKWSDYGYSSAEEYASSFSKRAKELTSKLTGFSIDENGNTTLTNQKNLGLNPTQTLQYQAQFAQMANSIGMVGESALATSSALTMLGADWASLRNISFDESWNKLASALAGQSRAVRSFGIDITQATLQEYAYKYGLEQSVSEMNQATKAQLRLLAILDQSKVAFGDLANTIQSPANQLRVLKQNFESLARIIGDVFKPVIENVLPYINAFVVALQRLFQWIGNLFGVKFKTADKSVGGMSDSFAEIADSDGLDSVSESADNMADALDDANKSAKKLKSTVASYDELEIMKKDSDTSNVGNKSSGIANMGGSPILDDAISAEVEKYQKIWDAAFGKMEDKVNKIADKITASFKKLWKVAEPTRKAVKKLWDEGLSKFRTFTWNSLKDFYNHFLVPLGKWTLGEGIPKLIEAFNNFLNKIQWDKIRESLINFWDALEPFMENVGTGLINFFSDLMNFGADFINSVIPGGLNAIAEAIRSIDPETAQEIGYALGELITAISGFSILKRIGSIIGSSGIVKFISALASHPLLTIAAGLSATVVALDNFGFIDVDWNKIKEALNAVKEKIVEFIEKIDWKTIWDALSNFASVLGDVADGFLDMSADIINLIADALKWFSDVVSGMSPEQLQAVGAGLSVIAAVKITTGFISRINGLAGALDTLKIAVAGLLSVGGFELGKWISEKFLGGEEITASDFVKEYIFGHEPGDFSGAIDQFLQDMAAKVHPLTDSDISFYETSENSILSLLKGGSIDGTNASTLLSFLSQLKSASEDSELAILELQNKFNELGIPDEVFDEFKRITEGLPESIRGVKTEVETNIVGAQEVITSSTKKAAQDANKNLTSIKDDAESTSGKVSETVGTNWSSSKGSVLDALSAMKGETSQKMREIYANVQSYTNSIWNITANNWDAIAKKVSLVLVEMVTNTRKSANQIVSLMSSMSLRIKYSLNGLYDIGYNAIIGLNNGMVKASDKLFENVQKIAQNVPKIFKSAWKIHSPSKLMENIMDMNIQGLIVSAENMSPKLYSVMGNIAAYMDDMIPRLQSGIGNISVNMQTDTRMIMPKAYTGMSNNGFGDDIRREIMAISSNTFNSNENVGAAVRSALNGMAVYADDKIVGYLRDKDDEWRNQNGRGIFEG